MNLPRIHLSSISYGPQLRPERDWLVLLATTIFLFVLSFGWNLWLFARVTNGAAVGSASASTSAQAVSVDQVQKLFEARSTEESNYRTVYTFVDPSVPGS